MKKTQLIESLINIKNNKIQSISMMIFIAGAICLFTGIGWRSQSMADVMDEAYKASRLYNIKIVIPEGVDDEAIADLSKSIDADVVTGGCDDYEEVTIDGESQQVLVKLLQDKVSVPYEIEGRLPEVEGEIAVKKSWAVKYGIAIGDTITFEDVERTVPSKLETSVFTVTSLVEMAEYLSTQEDENGINPYNGKYLNTVMYAADSSFNDASRETWYQVLVYKDELDTVNTFSDEYAEMSDVLESQIDKALNEILPDDAEYSLHMRNRTTSYGTVELVVGILDGMKGSLGLMFIFIGLLICYSCITRMVNDQLVSMGTKKALGMTTAEIRKCYVLFSGISLLGSAIIGVLLGRYFVEPLLVVYADRLVVDISKNIFRWKDVIEIVAVEAIGIIGTTIVTVNKVTSRPAKELLQGPTPTVAKERWFEKTEIWNKTPVLTKTIINNFLNEKSRVMSTMIGVAGVTMLIVSPITLYFNVMDCYNKHFSEYYYFDYIVEFDEEELFAQKKIEEVLDKYELDYAPYHKMNATLENPADGTTMFTFYVPTDRSGFHKFIHITGKDGETYEPYKGTWVTQAFMDYYGIEPGAEIEFADVIEDPIDVKIDGIAKHYLMDNAGYMDKETYEEYFDEVPEENAYLIDAEGISVRALEKDLKKIDGFDRIRDFKEDSADSFGAIEMILVGMAFIYILLGVIVAFLVILNLFYMTIDEKKKEIIVLRINGYSLEEAKKYIETDIQFTATISVILGTLLGEAFGCYSVSTYLSASSYFDVGFEIKSALIGAALSTLLVYILNKKSLKRIDGFELKDISK